MPKPRQRRHRPPLRAEQAAQWLRSKRGRRQSMLERRELRQVLPDLFGRHILQIGSWDRGQRLLAGSEMLHRAVIGTLPDFGPQALSHAESLPILSKSADAVVLPHTLEFARSPHHVLREVNRVLTDRGSLLVVGFNPWSLWGLRGRLGLRYGPFSRGVRFYSVGRLVDWLELLDFEVTLVRRFGGGFPWTAARSQGDRFSPSALLSPLSESYLLLAKKRVIPMTLYGRPARAQVIRPLIGPPVGVSGARREVP